MVMTLLLLRLFTICYCYYCSTISGYKQVSYSCAWLRFVVVEGGERAVVRNVLQKKALFARVSEFRSFRGADNIIK
jgi:hypothetical protein